MDKIRKILLLIAFILPLKIKAECTNQELSRYKNLSSNINTYYEYDETNNNFNITIYNLSNEIKIINKNDDNTYQTNTSGIGELNIGNLNPGTNITLAVYPINGECNDYRIRTIYINLPYYNTYYKDEICKNNNNTLCSKWANTSNYTYEQFVEKVKNTAQEETIEIIEPEKEQNTYSFFDFLGDFYIPILLFIIISGSIAIYYLDKKRKFDF